MRIPEIASLESQVSQLIHHLESLRGEHQKLQQTHRELLIQRDELLQKNDIARNKINNILERLKTMEETADGC